VTFFIAMSGIYLEAPRYARDRFGAKLVIVRASKAYLGARGNPRPPARGATTFPGPVARELAGYELADMIDVPSTHVVESFARAAQVADRIRVQPVWDRPFDVPLRDKVVKDTSAPVIFLFAGTWSLRKRLRSPCQNGLFVKLGGAKLLHAGCCGDLPPSESTEHPTPWED